MHCHLSHTHTADRCAVARLVSEDATPQQCQNRWTRYLDPRIKHEPFTEEEDRLLRDAIAVYGNAWNEIAQFLAGRTNEQCRERATELNTVAVKKRWTDDEDRMLLEATEDVEVIDFKEIANALGTGRTEAQVRRYIIPLHIVTHPELGAESILCPHEENKPHGNF